MICGQPVFAAVGRRHGIEIDVEREGAEVAVDIDTVVLEPQLLVQMARRSTADATVAAVETELLLGWHGPAECLEQTDQQGPVRAPHALRSQLDNAVDAIEDPQRLQLAIER